MHTATPIPPAASTAPWAAALTAILQADPVAGDILRFLLANESAMDSAKGIAAWWVHRDELAVQPALHRLCAGGAMLAHTLSSGTTLYGLTQDAAIRAWLREGVGSPAAPRAGGDRPAHRTTAAPGGART